MPIPKTASVAARATDVYSDVCSLVIDSLGKKDFSEEVYLLLPYLRQLLTCCACAGLLKDAMIALICGHCYCYTCQYGEPLMKIHCRQCRSREGLVIYSQLRLVVQLYNQLVTVISEKSSFHIITPVLQELITEVIDGVKVSREVFLVLPPQRYRSGKGTKSIKQGSSYFMKKKVKLSDKTTKRQIKSNPLINKCDSDEETLTEETSDLEITLDCLTQPYTTDRRSHFTTISNKKFHHVSFRPFLYKRTRSPFTPRLSFLPNSRAISTDSSLHICPESPASTESPENITKTPLLFTDVSKPCTSQGRTGSTQHAPLPYMKKRRNLKRKYICSLSREEIDELKQQPKYNCHCTSTSTTSLQLGHVICVNKRCPCFYNELPCSLCECKGCSNPYNYILNN